MEPIIENQEFFWLFLSVVIFPILVIVSTSLLYVWIPHVFFVLIAILSFYFLLFLFYEQYRFFYFLLYYGVLIIGCLFLFRKNHI